MFGWDSVDNIRKTIKNTTQWARLPTMETIKRAFQSTFPLANVKQRGEAVAVDYIYSDIPAVDDGSTGAYVHIGLTTTVTDAYGVKSQSEFVNTLEDNITKRGVPSKMVGDRAKVHFCERTMKLLRAFFIPTWFSQPYRQNQNPFEREWQNKKRFMNRIMDRTGAPPYTWLLCLQYVCYLTSRIWHDSMKAIPLTLLLGITVDISNILQYPFYAEV